ncbi:MAG: hypothetical protein U0L83_06805 [Muribaculaceae bacterium]|nr:hypothetical protein [Muribaculaceae bacterium]
MAAIGVLSLLYNMSKQRADFLNGSFLILSVWAVSISVVGYISTVINNTHDYTYSTYIVSMWVWIMSAYTLILVINWTHEGVTFRIIVNYLICVCVLQCLFSLLYEYNETFNSFIKSLNIGLELVFDTKGRMQGLAAALDPAGIRFAGTLVVLGYVIVNRTDYYEYNRDTWLYLASFILITVVGNMVSRTTTIGTALALLYLVACLLAKRDKMRVNSSNVLSRLVVVCIFSVLVISYEYNHNEAFHDNIRFGFEGFFSLVETGEWKTNSNEILKSMVVWPDNLKTWIIGDGYIINPSHGVDPFYVGETYSGFYKDTDIGYLRFIFYFGIIGLVCFSTFLIYAAKSCMDRFQSHKMAFLLLLIANFIIWFKVSTDIFQFFALFLAVPPSFIRRSNDVDVQG